MRRGSPALIQFKYGVDESRQVINLRAGQVTKDWVCQYYTNLLNETLTDLDVLFIPVGGVTALNASQAAEVVSQLEPRIVIPMHYQTPQFSGKLEPLDRFFKEMGISAVEEQDTLKVTKNSVPEETQVVVLKVPK